MPVFVWGSAIFALAFGLHLLIWRARRPRRQTRFLLGLFLACLAGGIVLLWTMTAHLAPGDSPGADLCNGFLPRQLAQYAHIALFVVSLALAYITTYSAVEVDSPSLVMVLAIARAGPRGLDPDRLQGQLSDDILVRPRVRDLLRDRLISTADGRYTLTAKGRRLVSLFIAYRALLGGAKGG